MCGIAGYVTKAGSQRLRAWAVGAGRLLSHRGPDDQCQAGVCGGRIVIGEPTDIPENSTVAFVHRRLSIIDLSPLGRQPMATPDNRFVLVNNGEIYNYRELRGQLESEHGIVFHSQSDTEVLLQSWATWGPDCLGRLIGMFAFAVFDRELNRLFLARDPVGIKPLYYAETPFGLAFSSEIAPLLEWPGVTRKADPQGVVDYLRFGFTDHRDQSMFSDVRQVRPGAWIEIDTADPSNRKTHAYWRPEPKPTLDLSFEDASERLRQMLLESIDLHLRSDVPVACCLSGGIDSSSIALMMRHVGGSGVELHTFSHIWPGKPFNEDVWVDTVNDACGAIPHKIESVPEDLAHDLSELVERQQVPFSTTSVYAQYRVMAALHESGIKVTLDGQGADELFGGYGFHVGARTGSLVKQHNYAAAWRLLQKAKSLPDVSTSINVQNMLDYLLPAGLQRAARSLGGRGLIPDWIDEDWCGRHDVSPSPYRTSTTKNLLKEAVCRSLAGPGLPHLLRYEDQNSMSFGVETRVPFLSQPLLDFALGLPEDYLVSDEAETKTLLRRAMRGIVPDAVLDRKDKVAFQTPELDWLRAMGSTVGAALTSETAHRIRGLDVGVAQTHWEKLTTSTTESALPVWRWLNLIEWTRIFDVTYPD